VIASAAALVVLIVVISVVVINNRPDGKVAAPPPSPAAFQASQSDQPLPTGLGISRKAEYDDSSATIRLTITYSAQKAPLQGPYLEIIPGLTKKAACPTVSWDDTTQKQNLPSVTGITTRCGWSISGVDIEAGETNDVTVEVHQKISSQQQLQDWLDKAAQATTEAIQDSEVSGTAYPVQRLQDIEITTPSRIVSQKTIAVTLVPVWPSGADPVNPLYESPSSEGDPSQMLVAVAGSEKNIRFIDGCSGALTVSSDGLTVTALSQAPECTINAQVGNFTNLSSQQFAIVTRGG
jgi:serine/threonine-protein kinase